MFLLNTGAWVMAMFAGAAYVAIKGELEDK